eukprot:9020531-Lingulodinium_polyedra.AAC.1
MDTTRQPHCPATPLMLALSLVLTTLARQTHGSFRHLQKNRGGRPKTTPHSPRKPANKRGDRPILGGPRPRRGSGRQ